MLGPPPDGTRGRKRLALAALVLAAAVLASSISTPTPVSAADGGFFNVNCGLSHRSHDDPIVFPGQPGMAHRHDFMGNRSTDADSTYRSMTRARSNCRLSVDTAGYWAPTLLDRNGNPVPIQRLNAYYRSHSGTRVRPFPKDLRIVAGGNTLDPPDPDRSQLSLSWSCGDTKPYTPSPPDCSGTDMKVTAHVHFPDCLLRGESDSGDHRSHMTYGNRCGPGYVQVPRLRLHIRYKVQDAEGFTLSSDEGDMVPGQSLHADFWNTWNQDALRFLVRRCLNAGRACAEMTDRKLRRLGF